MVCATQPARPEIKNGTDPDLEAFARQTLPKFEDHLQRALKLAEDVKRGPTASERLLLTGNAHTGDPCQV